MRELSDWLDETSFPDRPWLILGKGPTFGRRGEFDLTSFNLLALNHAAAEQKVDLAHAVDIDVVEACGEAILENARFLLMPRVPHIQSRVSLRRLEDFVDLVPALQELDAQGRLVCYDAETAPAAGGNRAIEVKYFSSEAALSILGNMGARVVRTLGIDGGQSYDSAFSRVEARTRLANGQPSFDLQFAELDRIARRWRIDLEPLVAPIRIFVGADETQEIAAKVLEHTIRRSTAEPVRFTAISNEGLPTPRAKANRSRTNFSFGRFRIPELCDHKGRAIYLDSDMQVFADIAELWRWPMGAHHLMCTFQDQAPEAWVTNSWFHPGPQMSVMLLDCERLAWDPAEIIRDLDRGKYTYAQLLFDMCLVPRSSLGTDLPQEWNHLERFEPNITKLTHYTVVPTQPWRADGNPLEDLWMEAYRSAVAEGVVSERLVEDHLARGWVKPALQQAFEGAPRASRPKAYASAAELELDAAWERIAQLHQRDPVWRARSLLARGMPAVRRLRRSPGIGPFVERSVDTVRRRLR